MKNPYRNIINESYNKDVSTIKRWEKTLEFLDHDKTIRSGLDIGDFTPLTNQLSEFYNIKFQNTEIDLDVGELSGKYDIITSFEVIEHLFNPLHHLLEIKKCLNNNGVLYLSTPRGKPYYLWSDDHFHEMHDKSLFSLINRAGFKIVKSRLIRIHPNTFYIKGLRPLLRYIYEKHWLIKLISD